MSIGATIKQLRRQSDMTQEQLAEYLGITSRAVSQWECDRTSPDLSLLPALCHLFDVSADTLLGIDLQKSEEAIAEYLARAREETNHARWENAVEILRDGLHTHPKSYALMLALAQGLVSSLSRQKKNDYSEVFDLCHRILAECTDNQTRYDTMDILATAYQYAGKEAELNALEKEMPRTNQTYESSMVYCWRGQKGLAERQRYMDFLIAELLSMISCLLGHRGEDGKFIHTVEERKALWQLTLDLLAVLFPDGDYQTHAYHGMAACNFMWSYARNHGDREAAMHWLEKCVDFAVYADTFDSDAPHEATHTSLILRDYGDGGSIVERSGNYSASLLRYLTEDEETKELREEPRVQTLIERLKKAARIL